MANIVTDFTKSAQQIIIDLVNNDNSLALTTAKVTFGAPTAATVGGSVTRDTDLTLTAVAGSGYSGAATIHYNRVDLASVPGARSTVFPIGTAVNISDLIAEINAAYGINLSNTADTAHKDYVDGPLPTFTGTANEQHQFQLAADADSLVWENSVQLTVQANDIPLSTAITNPTLNGLTYVQPA